MAVIGLSQCSRQDAVNLLERRLFRGQHAKLALQANKHQEAVMHLCLIVDEHQPHYLGLPCRQMLISAATARCKYSRQSAQYIECKFAQQFATPQVKFLMSTFTNDLCAGCHHHSSSAALGIVRSRSSRSVKRLSLKDTFTWGLCLPIPYISAATSSPTR